MSMGNRDLKVRSDYLDELIKFHSAALVGKLMKRFELFDDKNIIKASVKELVYEAYRDFREILKAHSAGLDITQFHFQRPDHKS